MIEGEVSKKIVFTVFGNPTAQKRHRSVRMGGFLRQFDPSGADKADFLSMCLKNKPVAPIVSGINLTLKFYFQRPKSHFRSGKQSHLLKPEIPNFHTSRPDVDNLTKFVMDALNGIYWKDDSQIHSITVEKKYSDIPRTEIEIVES